MPFEVILDFLWWHTWWSYGRDRDLEFSLPYRYFNLLEGTIWVVLSILVVNRWRRTGRGTIELWYALAFFTFGLSDYRESYYQQSWLIWLKLINLVVLLRLRHIVIQQLYPGTKLF